METRIRALAALSLAAITTLGGCFDTGEDRDTGTVGVSLVGHGMSGAVYRLRDATITVSGASPTVVWNTEDDPDRTSLSADVNIGDYSAALAPGWRLERIVMGQPPVDVVAQLISPNPAAFSVEPMERTEVAFRFATDGTVVDMSQGYDIVIDVEEALPVNIVAAPAALTLVEGASASFAVALSAAPVAPLTVTVASSDPSAAVTAPAMLTFTPANFNLPQVVTVNGVQDADSSDEMVVVTLAATGVPSVTIPVQVSDDDDVFMVTSVSSVSLTEGSNAVVGLRLTAQPPAIVTVTVQSSDPSAVGVVPSTLTFTPANWNLFQNVTVTGVQDVDLLGETVNLLFNSPGLPGVLVVVNVLDDDVQTIITSVSTLTINEGGNAAFNVRLAAQPAAPVSVNVVSSDASAVVASPTTLTFTPTSFNVPQTVVVAGVQDADNLDETVTVVLSGPGTPTTTVAVLVVDDE